MYFQHYTSFEEAKKKWNERKNRINWNNIYFVWEYYETLCKEEWIHEFDKLPIKKLIITHKHVDGLENAQVVHCYDNDKPVAKILQYNGLSEKRYLEEEDYIHFLNS